MKWSDEQIGTDWWRVIENLGETADGEVVSAIVTLIEKGIHPSEVRHLVELMQVTSEIKP